MSEPIVTLRVQAYHNRKAIVEALASEGYPVRMAEEETRIPRGILYYVEVYEKPEDQ